MKKFILLITVLFTSLFSTNAQNNEAILRLQSFDNNGIKKDGEGKCFALSFVKEKVDYTVILIHKEFFNDSKEIKVFIKQEQQAEPFIITIPTDSKDIIKSKNLVAIPYAVIRKQLENKNNVIHPTFILDVFIPEFMTGITEKDVDEIKQEMEKWINNE